MTLFLTRFLIAALILSQVWTGALRGIEICIPTGLCEGCGVAVAGGDLESHANHDAATSECSHHALHRHADGRVHRHQHPSTTTHPRSEVARLVERCADRVTTHEATSSIDCACHIHVATPEDDAERRTAAPSSLPLFVAVVGTIDPWIVAAGLPTGAAPPARPPNDDGPPDFEQVVIDTTELLV